jgi:predicted Zn-dependent protease
MQRGMLLQGAISVAAVAGRNSDFSNVAVGAASVGAQLINMRHGRGDELESDAYGMEYMSRAAYDPSAAISLQETFVRLAGGRDGGGRLAGLFASHPPSAERVTANRATAARLPPGGTIGQDSHAAATARMRREAPGYEAVDAARAALADADIALARREAERARQTLGDSADLQALLGDIELAAEQTAAALRHYDAGLLRNPRFFATHLGAGEAHRRLGQLGDGEGEYRASIELLPTADAYLGLGRIAESRGNVSLALEHYGQAAGSSGRAGTAARASVLRLDLPRNPETYLSLASGLDSNGQLVVEIANGTDAAVSNIVLAISYLDGGEVRQTRRTLSETLAAGSRRRYATGLGPFSAPSDFDVGIDSAAIAASP